MLKKHLLLFLIILISSSIFSQNLCIESDTSESFENGLGNTWLQDPNNDINWTNRSGSTPSPQTGPSAAFSGSFYMYTEASLPFGQYANRQAIIYINCVDPSKWNKLSLAFAYHMYGSSMGTLSIEVSTDNGSTWNQEWDRSGNQGNQWNETYIDLSSYISDISVRIKSVTGSSFRSDMAVDLVRFTEMPNFGCTNPLALNYDSTATTDNGTCYFSCIESDTSESFENGLGNTWLQDPNSDIDWTNTFGGTPSIQTLSLIHI